jgi:anhydro-N-acetylmuramic acid kinase
VKETILPLIEATKSYRRQIKFIYETHRYSNCCIITFKKGKLLITGGGAYNDFLIEMIQEQLPKWK